MTCLFTMNQLLLLLCIFHVYVCSSESINVHRFTQHVHRHEAQQTQMRRHSADISDDHNGSIHHHHPSIIADILQQSVAAVEDPDIAAHSTNAVYSTADAGSSDASASYEASAPSLDRLQLSVNHLTGDYHLSVGTSTWLESSPTFFTSAWMRHTAPTHLKLLGSYEDYGTDNLGSWSSTVLRYAPADSIALEIHAIFKTYFAWPNIVLFGQYFPDGINGSSSGPHERVSSGFPSFTVNASLPGTKLGYLAYGGIMFGDTGKRVGVWDADDVTRIESGLDSGPLVLFNSLGDTLVISSFYNFMSVSTDYHRSDTVDGSMSASWGVLGTATHIPRDFSVWTVVSYSSAGINEAMRLWGEALRIYYRRGTEYRDADITNNYIGYYTDNGAYYYYLTEKDKDYQVTLIDVKDYADKLRIPYRYIQYDSWFYPKDTSAGGRGGVKEWIAQPSIFPRGMHAGGKPLHYIHMSVEENAKTQEKVSVFMAHQPGITIPGWCAIPGWDNNPRSDETVYAVPNGGKYNFIIEKANKRALPLDPDFWYDLLKESRKWGLIIYEQDWLNEQFDTMNATVSSVTIGRDWLIQMGNGARKSGVNIQYCMAPSRHALTSLEIPNVVQGRVSNDYLLGADQWKIGVSSMFAHAIGVAPFKDNFWTTTDQPGNPYNKTEPYPELESLVATLSTGPVAPGDRIGYSNPDLIMRSCNADGLILKPSRPATAVDQQLLATAFSGFTGEVWSTYSNITGYTFGLILAVDFKPSDKFSLTPTAAGFRPGPQSVGSYVYSWYDYTKASLFSDKSPLMLTSCYKKPFCFYITSPIFTIGATNITVYGELDKWVPMSERRVVEVRHSSSELSLSLEGAPSEIVYFSYTINSIPYVTQCTMSAEHGRAVLHVMTQTCVKY